MTWKFEKNRTEKDETAQNDLVELSMLNDKIWVFDVYHNGVKLPHMVMNKSRAGQKTQGVPISWTSDSFKGHVTPGEARIYKENWRKTILWLGDVV